MDKNIIEKNVFPLQPRDLDTHKRFVGAFENSETDVSAHYIVRMCQEELGGWLPFSL